MGPGFVTFDASLYVVQISMWNPTVYDTRSILLLCDGQSDPEQQPLQPIPTNDGEWEITGDRGMSADLLAS